MGEQKGPGGPPQPIDLGDKIAKKSLEAVVKNADQATLTVESVVDEIIAFCSANTDKEIRLDELKEVLISKGVPASFFTVYDRGINLKLSIVLSIAKNTSVNTEAVRGSLTDIFTEFNLMRFMEASKDPVGYFRDSILALLSSDKDFLENLSLDEINSLMRTFLNLQGKGLTMLREAITPAITREVKSVFGKKILVGQHNFNKGELTIDGGCTPEEGAKIKNHIRSVLPHVSFSPYNFLEKNRNSVWKIDLFPAHGNRF